jgi:hypothetical protein
MEETKIYSTRDIYLASTLAVLGFEIVGVDCEIEGVKPRAIGYFKFEETDELSAARMKYTQGKALVEPRAFVQTMQSLKSETTNLSRSLS